MADHQRSASDVEITIDCEGGNFLEAPTCLFFLENLQERLAKMRFNTGIRNGIYGDTSDEALDSAQRPKTGNLDG